MKWKNLVKVAFKSILKNRMRSFLTMLGIIIGVGAVILIVSLGEGAQANIQSNLTSLGSNLLMVSSGTSMHGGVSRGAGSMMNLTLSDAEKISKEATLVNGVSPVVRSGGQIIGGGNNWSTTVYGVSPEYQTIRDWSVKYGSFFTEREVRGRSKVALIGATVAEELFPGQDPVGALIRIRNVPFKVIGVLEEKGEAGMGMDRDDLIIAPVTTVLYRLSDGKNINEINVSATDSEVMDAAEEEIQMLLREAHRIQPGEDDDFTIRSQMEIIDTMTEITDVLTIFLGSIAGISLIVGGIGIMNIMLVSVTERTREIGIRLAVGARESDVLIQFLVEAMVLSFIGGIFGIIAGIGLALVLDYYINSINALVNYSIIAIAFFFSGAVGVFFGFYPAKKAAALNPIDALRYE